MSRVWDTFVYLFYWGWLLCLVESITFFVTSIRRGFEALDMHMDIQKQKSIYHVAKTIVLCVLCSLSVVKAKKLV